MPSRIRWTVYQVGRPGATPQNLPNRHKSTRWPWVEQVRFLTLAICGEAGELANLMKKSWRGDAIDLDEVRHEIADIRIYLNQLAMHLGFDIDDACEQKLDIVTERIAAKKAEAA